MIPIKSQDEIRIMREAGAIAATVLHKLAEMVQPGVTTYDLDQQGKQLIESFGAKSACFNYTAHGISFPSYTCISVNEEVVHGIGTIKRIIQQGDIVSLDVSVVYDGYIGDNAKTVLVEPVAQEVKDLVKTTQEALMLGIAQARAGNRVGDISHAIQRYVQGKHYGIVREFVGHGVGKTMHEEPQIPNFGPPKKGPKLMEGMTLAIEPMVNLGRQEVEYAKDGWTILTKDRKPSAHFEHSILVTSSEPEILTLPKK